MIEIQIRTTKETEDFLRKFPDKLREGLVKGVKKATYFTEAEAKKSFGKAGNLQVVTGHLRRSIKSKVREQGSSIIGTLFSDVIYARVHEEGAVIRPRAAQYLVFRLNGNWIKAKRVRIPPRPYLKPAIQDNLNRIEDIISKEILKEVD